MGRDRLRRGCSLEVIFEEDDFCSNLDSLDPLPYQRRAHKGDAFSIDTLFSELSSPFVLERQERSSEFKSLDGFLDLRETDMDSCFVEWDEFSGDSLRSERGLSLSSQDHSSDSVNSSNNSGRRSRVSRRQIVEASWVMDEEPLLPPPNPKTTNLQKSFDGKGLPPQFPDFDDENSANPMTEETYAAFDQFDEQHSLSVSLIPNITTTTAASTKPSNKLSWNDSRDGSQKGSCRSYANPSIATSKSPVGSLANMNSAATTDVKRVRALFENSSASSSEDETNSRKFNKANKRLKESSSNSGSLSSFGGLSGSMRSAYSHLSLNQMERGDFADLLVNDNVIIEDSPDVYQMFRLRHRDNLGGSGSKVSTSAGPFSRGSTLRRSKSVGAGIHQLDLEEEENMNQGNPSSNEDLNKERQPRILAEEMPAPDTVKNVRTVFEKLYQKSKVVSQENVPPVSSILANNPKSLLSSIRSNPTSKILRSESMRNESNRTITTSATPRPVILGNSNPVRKTQEISKVFEARKSEQVPKPRQPSAKVEPIPRTVSKIWPKVAAEKQKQLQQLHQPFSNDEEEHSLPSLSSSTTADENEERKEISPDVLQRIRSLGTTTTYFGGEIVAKTVNNRKLAVTPKKPTEDIPDYETSSLSYPSDEIFFSARPNQILPSPERPRSRPYDLQFNPPGVDTTPRIISVLPKSQSGTPTKSNSPVLEGRNSPEGCESTHHERVEWINDAAVEELGVEVEIPENPEDTNNNSIKYSGKSNKFSAAAEGAWF